MNTFKSSSVNCYELIRRLCPLRQMDIINAVTIPNPEIKTVLVGQKVGIEKELRDQLAEVDRSPRGRLPSMRY
jgi:hypothetical protein